MKRIFISLLAVISTYSFGQIGINTNDPKTTLDVVGNPTDASSKDGIIAPRLTGDQLRAKSGVYGLDQTGAIVYATEADSTPSGKTINVTIKGYYYFDGSKWINLVIPSSFKNTENKIGDVKYAFQTNDHDGWFLLDGREISSLPSYNQEFARSIFSDGNLPNAGERVLKMKGNLGSTGGQISTSITISQGNLPKVNLNGTTTNSGAHTHSITNNTNSNWLIAGGTSYTAVTATTSSYYAFNGARYLNSLLNDIRASISGDHNHQISLPLNNNSEQSPIEINTENNYLSVNVFVFLGVN